MSTGLAQAERVKSVTWAPGSPQTERPAKNPQTEKPAKNPQTEKPAGPQTEKPAGPQTKKPAKPNPGKPAVKERVGDPKKRMRDAKKLIKKNLKRLVVKGGARFLGALGGPVGMAAVTCADIGFDLAYQAGSALGRRNHPTTPADPGGNKILKKQSDGTYKWVPGPKPSRNNGPLCGGKIGQGPPPGGNPNPQGRPAPAPAPATSNPSAKPKTTQIPPNIPKPKTDDGKVPERNPETGGTLNRKSTNDTINDNAAEQTLEEIKRKDALEKDRRQKEADRLGKNQANYWSAVEVAKERIRQWQLGLIKGPCPKMPNPQDFGL